MTGRPVQRSQGHRKAHPRHTLSYRSLVAVRAEWRANAADLINEISAYADGMKYILHLRGVFKTYSSRQRLSEIAGAANRTLLDETGKQVLREILDLMKPQLRA